MQPGLVQMRARAAAGENGSTGFGQILHARLRQDDPLPILRGPDPSPAIPVELRSHMASTRLVCWGVGPVARAGRPLAAEQLALFEVPVANPQRTTIYLRHDLKSALERPAAVRVDLHGLVGTAAEGQASAPLRGHVDRDDEPRTSSSRRMLVVDRPIGHFPRSQHNTTQSIVVQLDGNRSQDSLSGPEGGRSPSSGAMFGAGTCPPRSRSGRRSRLPLL